MDTKTTIISQKAANWWSMEIEQNATEDFVKGLDDFESQLSKEIQYTISIYHHMYISTISNQSNILTKVALQTNMNAAIPLGFKMYIKSGECAIFDANDSLVENF